MDAPPALLHLLAARPRSPELAALPLSELLQRLDDIPAPVRGAINASFGSFDKFKEDFSSAAAVRRVSARSWSQGYGLLT